MSDIIRARLVYVQLDHVGNDEYRQVECAFGPDDLPVQELLRAFRLQTDWNGPVRLTDHYDVVGGVLQYYLRVND